MISQKVLFKRVEEFNKIFMYKHIEYLIVTLRVGLKKASTGHNQKACFPEYKQSSCQLPGFSQQMCCKVINVSAVQLRYGANLHELAAGVLDLDCL